jgi:hypothetical protein
MPDTRPRTTFDKNGACNECRWLGKWEGRPMCRCQQSFDSSQRWLDGIGKVDFYCDYIGDHHFEQKKEKE